MIKGVNKRIIEVLNPDEPCFEKIILFLSPDCKLSEQFLVKSTGEYVRDIAKALESQSVTKKETQKKRLIKSLLFCVVLLICTVVGGVLTVILT